jgi:hypothetical protein
MKKEAITAVECGKTYNVRLKNQVHDQRKKRVKLQLEKHTRNSNDKEICKVLLVMIWVNVFGIKMIYFDLDKSNKAALDLEKYFGSESNMKN